MRATILRARPEMHEALPISEIEAEISINDAINQATLWRKEHQKETGSKRGRKGKINNLVPGAGLEPARTLPGPRDFKSHFTLTQQHQAKPKTRFFKSLSTGVCSCLLVLFDGLGTATGTVWAQSI
jgi:hypothetical protein